MADHPQVTVPTADMAPIAQVQDSHDQVLAFDVVEPPPEFFKMRGRDVTCPAGQQPAFVYWVVQDAPDETGAFADVSDLICGSDPLTDIVDIEVAMRWKE